jgi:hypothetical protein
MFDGATPDAAVELLDATEADAVLTGWNMVGDEGMAGTRRWFTSFGSCSVAEPLDDLVTLGLLEAPR